MNNAFSNIRIIFTIVIVVLWLGWGFVYAYLTKSEGNAYMLSSPPLLLAFVGIPVINFFLSLYLLPASVRAIRLRDHAYSATAGLTISAPTIAVGIFVLYIALTS